ncbi:MAG: hypothetical protein WC760_02880 [Bacteroidia bacterium]|jgi:hypothetical protein
MKATIIGDQPLEKFPSFEYDHSYGLNYAASKRNTQFAFTGHQKVYDTYIHLGILDIIGIDPTFEGRKFPDLLDVIRFDPHQAHNYDCSEDYAMRYVIAAIAGEDIAYPNRMTILHLAMFYCLKKGYTEIDLLACANNYDELGSISQDHERGNAPYMRAFTGAIVACAARCGVKINWIKQETTT